MLWWKVGTWETEQGREGVKQLPAISQSASGSLGSTLLIKLCTNISFSIRGILIRHTDQGHSDYYTLLKINFKNGLVLEVCCRDVCPSLKLQKKKVKRKAVHCTGKINPGKLFRSFWQWVVTVFGYSLFTVMTKLLQLTLRHSNGKNFSSITHPSVGFWVCFIFPWARKSGTDRAMPTHWTRWECLQRSMWIHHGAKSPWLSKMLILCFPQRTAVGPFITEQGYQALRLSIEENSKQRLLILLSPLQ